MSLLPLLPVTLEDCVLLALQGMKVTVPLVPISMPVSTFLATLLQTAQICLLQLAMMLPDVLVMDLLI